jgi:hypothetical protein
VLTPTYALPSRSLPFTVPDSTVLLLAFQSFVFVTSFNGHTLFIGSMTCICSNTMLQNIEHREIALYKTFIHYGRRH